MYFNIKCIGKLPGPTNEFERSLVFETGEFERPKFDCTLFATSIGCERLIWNISRLYGRHKPFYWDPNWIGIWNGT